MASMAGIISSPGYPANFRRKTECRWDIAVPQGFELVLKFISRSPRPFLPPRKLPSIATHSENVRRLGDGRFCFQTSTSDRPTLATRISYGYRTSHPTDPRTLGLPSAEEATQPLSEARATSQ